MRKILASFLAAVSVASVLASCATHAPDTGVTLASSGTEKYAGWLEDRLGSIPDGVVLGIGSDTGYGVDMTGFESDGYIIRTAGDDTVIFGKSADGLDMAVRKYASAVESGCADGMSATYHEGVRVERLTIAGRDISEYTVYISESANENMKFAASELCRLIKKATGAELAIVAGEPKSPAIELRHSDDPELCEEGYRYSVTDDGVVIEGAVDRGCSSGVYRFLEHELDWTGLMFGHSSLPEAEHIDISAGTERSETPAFEHFRIYNPYAVYNNEKANATAVQMSYPRNPIACHGLQNNNFFGDYPNFLDQPCYTDEERYEICRDNVDKFIAARYGDPNFRSVDIAAYDTENYCFCENCLPVFKEEGGNAGAVVRFANKLSEEMNEKYPGLIYLIFGYMGTNVPPKKSVPNDMVYVTYCFDLNCSNHTLDGKNCSDKKISQNRKAYEYGQWFEGWCEVTDNICVWYYTLGTALQAYTVIDNIYDDYKYLAEHNVKGLFLETENYGEFGMKCIENQLEYEMIWNTDMTREEFEEYYKKLLEKEYGPGWSLIYDYEKKWDESQNVVDCWHGWGWAMHGPWDYRYSTTYYAAGFDSYCKLMEDAISMAESQKQVDRLNKLYATILYMGCYSSYFPAYLAGDTERIAVLEERYEQCLDIVRGLGYDPQMLYTISTGEGGAVSYSPTLYEAAWKDWRSWFDEVTGQPLPADAPVVK